MIRSLLTAAILALSLPAAAHPWSARDVVGGEDVSEGWQCRIGHAPPAPCRDLALPAGRGRVQVTIERTFTGSTQVTTDTALSLGHFATPIRVSIDGRPAGRFGPGLAVLERPALRPGSVVAIETTASSYRRAPAWDGRARLGPIGARTDGWLVAPRDATRRPMLVHLPPHLDGPAPLLVALHPWGVGPWAYVGSAIVEEATRAGWIVLAPDGLGNSLWVGDAETEALSSIDAMARALPVDPDRVYLFGASMGGAGATTIGLRHPDRFAALASFFGDSRYALGSYTDAVLPDQQAVDAASCLGFAENARHVPVLLVHGRLDATSALVQSTQLAERLATLGLAHELVVRDDRGHEARLVDEEARRTIAFLGRHRRAPTVPRVSLRSAPGAPRRAYWLEVVPQRADRWSFADVEIDDAGAVRVLARENVRRLRIDPARAPRPPMSLPEGVDLADAQGRP